MPTTVYMYKSKYKKSTEHTNLIKELAKLQFRYRRHQMKHNFTTGAKGKLL